MSGQVKCVILAGGSGLRLWPLSRAKHPKQFLRVADECTMLQKTVKRLDSVRADSLEVIVNEEYRFLLAQQLKEINRSASIILEPVAKNTAPAIAVSALLALNEDPNTILLVSPADHVITDETALLSALENAKPLAEAGNLVTFGVVPTSPHSGYGYIKRGEKQGVGHRIDEFVEKPSVELAETFLNSEDYYWNSGMFMFRASAYLNELRKFRPDIYDICAATVIDMETDSDFARINSSPFELCKSESIDYAVMEHTENAIVVPIEGGWSDVGSWSSLWEVNEKDSEGNVAIGDVTIVNSRDSYVWSDDRLVVTLGVENLVVVSTPDALLVAAKDKVEKIKAIVEQFRNESRVETEHHRVVSRPWGCYESLDAGAGHQVKRITVNPGAKLSVQEHQYRAEHWVVVCGTAKVTKGKDTFLLSENESTYIPIGEIHSLENPGESDLELIEVQTGSYLGEDDIIRYDDIYGRN